MYGIYARNTAAFLNKAFALAIHDDFDTQFVGQSFICVDIVRTGRILGNVSAGPQTAGDRYDRIAPYKAVAFEPFGCRQRFAAQFFDKFDFSRIVAAVIRLQNMQRGAVEQMVRLLRLIRIQFFF